MTSMLASTTIISNELMLKHYINKDANSINQLILINHVTDALLNTLTLKGFGRKQTACSSQNVKAYRYHY